MSEFERLLRHHLGANYEITTTQASQLQAHYELMMRWNPRINLTAITNLEEAVIRHYCESIALARALPDGPLRVIDAGSGAGFPGIPLAVMRPECTVMLVEVDIRKSIFLRESSLCLPNCKVIQDRLQNVKDSADWLVSRALHWQEMAKYLPPIARNVALLVSGTTAREITQTTTVAWRHPLPLPWGDDQIVLIGAVNA